MKFGLSTLLAITGLAPTAQAFSTGAGGCAGGTAAVGGPGHLRDGATTGSLADGGVTISVGGVDLAAGAILDATVMEEVTITATAGGDAFKGILVRLESGATDMTGVLASSSSLLQDAAACIAPVAGITHNSPEEKTSVDVAMMPDAAGTVQMDVTVVMLNNGDGSIYYHDTFTVEVAEAGEMDMEDGEEMVDPPADPPTSPPADPPTGSAATGLAMGVSALVVAASFLLM